MQFFKVKGQSLRFCGVAYQPDGRTLITATQKGLVTLWDLDAGRELTRLGGNTRINAMALSPDGRLLATVGDIPTMWNVETGEIAAGFDCSDFRSLRGVTFARAGQRLLAGIYNQGQFRANKPGLAIWDTANGAMLPTLPTLATHTL